MSTFAELGINKEFIEGLADLGITTPSEIQKQAIPFLLEGGRDLIGQAQTGTGKTAAFGLPILQNIDPKSDKIQALILCPTRELAQQISKQLFRFTKYCNYKIFSEPVFGGEKIDIQIGKLKRPTHIVVATPGRLCDLLDRKALDLKQIKTLVLDEADEMLSMGFKKDLKRILDHTSGSRCTWLFSATVPNDIKDIIEYYLSNSAMRIEVLKKDVVNKDIEHQYLVCEIPTKPENLYSFLQNQAGQRGIVFCRTKAGADKLCKQMKARDVKCEAIHGDLTQKERDKVMRAFKNESTKILITTDITARGIDVANLGFVVHFMLPDNLEYYTHRSGRTGRAGNRGISISFVTQREMPRIYALERDLNISFARIK